MGIILTGCTVTSGTATGALLKSDTPLSFWGGVSPKTGAITNAQHPLFGETVTNKVLALPKAKGSSGAGLILLEMLRLETGPKAIVAVSCEPILAAGPVVGKHFYQSEIPILTLSQNDFNRLKTGMTITVSSETRSVEIHSD